MEEIRNKVAESGIVTMNLEDYYPPGERVLFDVSNCLYEGLLLREKDFRQFVKEKDWSEFKDKYVAVFCSTDAIVPTWAYMLLVTALKPYAKKVVIGNAEVLETILFNEAIKALDANQFSDKRIVIKGCGNLPVPVSAYADLTAKLLPVAKSIMYGEACSTVPVYKR